jgi:predicted metal-dependent phosphoesterase TrpH
LRIDLHCHSNYSDGVLSPDAVVARAAANGVQVLALTDHDTVDGLPAAESTARTHGIDFVCGVELSVSYAGRTLHVVGLGIDPESPALLSGLGRVRADRLWRAEAIDHKLAALGIRGAYAGAMTYASSSAALGRTHFARHLVACGAAKDMKTAFRRYLGEGRSAYVKHTWPELAEAVTWIREAGGVAVLAHPARYGLRIARLRILLSEFRSVGGLAVEVVTASHTPDHVKQIASLAAESGFMASLGSDFHCPTASWMDVGKLPPLPDICQPVWRHGQLARLH